MQDRTAVEIANRYSAGESGTALAAEYGLPYRIVYRTLRRLGVSVRPRGGRKPVYGKSVTDMVVEQYQSGRTMRQIYETLDIGFGTVQRIIQRNSVARPNGTRTRTISMPSDPCKIGYLAGIFDGEGNLQFKRRPDSIGIRVQVYNTNAEVMRWLQGTVGGSVRWDEDRTRREGWRPIGIWSLYRAADVYEFLFALLPSLIVKRAAAEAGLTLLRARGIGAPIHRDGI